MTLKLVLCEWRKILSGPFVKVLLVILLLANMVLAGVFARDRSYVSEEKQYFVNTIYELWEQSPERFYREYENIIDEIERDEEAILDSSLYGNSRYFAVNNFKSVLKVVEANKYYHANLEKILAQSEQYIFHYQLDGRTETYQYRYQEQMSRIYSRLNEVVTLGDSPVVGWNEFFAYQNEFFFVFVLIANFAVSIGTNDRRNGFYTIVSTCINGRVQTIVAKFIAAISSAVFVVLAFTASTLISVWAVCGYSDPCEAIQAVTTMVLFPYAVSISGAVFLSIIIKVVVAVLFSSVLFVVSALFKRVLFSYGVGLGVLAFQLWARNFDALTVGQWKYFNLWHMYIPDSFLSRYRAVSVFSRSVNLVWIVVLAFVFVTVGALLLSCFVYCKKALQHKTIQRSHFTEELFFAVANLKQSLSKGVRMHCSLVRYEIFKHRIFHLMLVILIIVKGIASSDYYESYDSAYDRIYQSYLEDVGGEYTDEKYEFLQEEKKAVSKIIARFDEMEAQVNNGLISGEEYSTFYKEYSMATIKRQVLTDMTVTADYLKELYDLGISPSFVYEPGYTQYSVQGIDWLLIVAVVLFSCRFYLMEYEASVGSRNAMMLVRSTAKGRGALLWRKMLICLATVTAVWVVFTGIDFYCLTRWYELPEMSALLVSMVRYTSAPSGLTIEVYTVLTELAGLVGVWILSVLCFFAAWLVKKTIYTYAILSLVMVVPTVAASAGIGVASRFDLTMLLNTDGLFRYSLTEHQSPVWFVVFLTAAAALAVVMTVICTCRIRKGGKA